MAAVRALQGALDVAAAVLLAAVLAITAARVVGRYMLGLPMPWSEELTRLLFMWLVMLAAARATHMQIDLLPRALPHAYRRPLSLFIVAVSCALLGLLVHRGTALVELTAYDRYTALGVSVQYLYWSLVVGGGLWILMLLATTFLEPDEQVPPGP